MKWSRETGAVVFLAMIASAVSLFAIQQQFQARRPSQPTSSSVAIDGQIAPLFPPPPFVSPFPDSDFSESEVFAVNDAKTESPSNSSGDLLKVEHENSEHSRESKLGSRKSSPPQLLGSEAPSRRKSSVIQPALQELDAEDSEKAAVRKVIEDEMVGTSREEREIWYEELKSLPAGVVRDLLQVRKQLRSLPRALHKSDAPEELPPTALRTAELPAEPVSQTRRQPFPDWTPTHAAIEQAMSLSRHNFANSATPGFKRIRWSLVDSYDGVWVDDSSIDVVTPTKDTRLLSPADPSHAQADSTKVAIKKIERNPVTEAAESENLQETPPSAIAPDGPESSSEKELSESNRKSFTGQRNPQNLPKPEVEELPAMPAAETPSAGIHWQSIQGTGCRLAPPMLDMKPGTLQKTGRALDLAIDGDGFFVVKVNEKLRFSRCGAIVLDSQRRLRLALVDGQAVIHPVITVPADLEEIQITASGQVLALKSGSHDSIPVGQLQLARFPSPERLQPIGSTLLAATSSSGVPVVDLPGQTGRGSIQQGCLEQSNVEVSFELSEIERLQSLMKMLPIHSRPFTASGNDALSR